MIRLSEQSPLGTGRHRKCYAHPEDAQRCIKIVYHRGDGGDKEIDPKLRPMTGLDKPVAAFLDRHTEVHNFIYQTRSYLELWLPMLETNNRSYLTVAIGCTGGKHRSVYIAEQLADYFRSRGKNVQSRHRTLEKRKP